MSKNVAEHEGIGLSEGLVRQKGFSGTPLKLQSYSGFTFSRLGLNDTAEQHMHAICR